LRGETRMWPGRRGLRFTRAKERGVVWKTYMYRVCSAGKWLGWDCLLVATVPTCEVTVKGPNFIREVGKGGIVVVCCSCARFCG